MWREVEQMKRYQELADQISGQIRSGVLRPGERVPSVRKVSRSRKLSPATVLQAYRLLESHGEIRARPRSGYYVSAHWGGLPAEPEISHPPKSSSAVEVTDLVFEILEASKAPNIVPLGAAFIDAGLFPLQKLARHIGAAARRMAPKKMADALPPGYPELRRAIARRYLESGFMVRPDEIVVTCGGLEALHLALQAVTRPGDTVAIEAPCFYSCLQLIELLGLKALQIPTHPREGIELGPLGEALAKQRVKACWVMTNFQNPLGSLMPEEKKKELVGLVSRYDVPLIEDDVYEELYFTTDKPKPAKAFDWKGLVLHCSSFSKSLGPGHRVGWSTAGRFAKRVYWIKLMTTLATNIVAQAAIADYLKHGGYDHYLRGLRRTLSTGRDHMLAGVTKHFPPGTRCVRPEGGYHMWVELPEKVNALDLHREAMEAGISIAPGPIFSAQKQFGNFVRLNYGHPWTPRLDKALATLGNLARARL